MRLLESVRGWSSLADVYLGLLSQGLVILLDGSHVAGSEDSDFVEELSQAMLQEGVGMQIDGGHFLQIALQMLEYVVFVEQHGPRLHPTRHREDLLHSKSPKVYPDNTITGTSSVTSPKDSPSTPGKTILK